MIGTVEELRVYLNTTGGGGQSDDALLGDLLAAASDRVIDLVPDRTLIPTPALVPVDPDADPVEYVDTADPVDVTRDLTGRTVQVPDLREVVSIAIDGVAYTGTYTLRARTGQPALWVRFPLRYSAGVLMPPAVDVPGAYMDGTATRQVTITGRWGPATGPAPRVKEAVLIWAARVYQERAARWSDARADPESGVQSYFRAVPPSIKATLDSLKVPGV